MNKLHLIYIMLLLAGTVIAQQPKAIILQTANGGTENLLVSAGVKNSEVYHPEEKRFALVMGVSEYDVINPLPCVRNDVDQMKRTLLSSGFDVATALNKTKAEFEQILKYAREYCIDNNYDIILVYFSGHGAQFNNVQMLAPKDFTFKTSEVSTKLKEFMDNSIMLPNVIDNFNIPDAKAVLAISDACRSYDYSKEMTDAPLISLDIMTKLNKMGKLLEGKGNVGIIYSSLPGEYSYPSTNLSIFTQYLSKILAKKPTNFGNLAIKLTNEMKAGGEKQVPVNTNNPTYYDFNFYRPIEVKPQVIVKEVSVKNDALFVPKLIPNNEKYITTKNEFSARTTNYGFLPVTFDFKTLYGDRKNYRKNEIITLNLTVSFNNKEKTTTYYLKPNKYYTRRVGKYENAYHFYVGLNSDFFYNYLYDEYNDGVRSTLSFSVSVNDSNDNELYNEIDISSISNFYISNCNNCR